MGDDRVELRMQERLSAADDQHSESKIGQPIDPLKHQIDRHWLGKVIELVAIRAREIASTNWYYVREDRMAGGKQPFGDHPELAHAASKANMYWNNNAPTQN